MISIYLILVSFQCSKYILGNETSFGEFVTVMLQHVLCFLHYRNEDSKPISSEIRNLSFEMSFEEPSTSLMYISR